jgi:hypothetical protein
LKEVGHGQFGVVSIGVADGIVPGKKRVHVAVKALQEETETSRDEFFAEAAIMKVCVCVCVCVCVFSCVCVCVRVLPVMS